MLVQDFLSGWFEVYLGFVLDLLRVGVWFILGWFAVCLKVSSVYVALVLGLVYVSLGFLKDGLGFMWVLLNSLFKVSL